MKGGKTVLKQMNVLQDLERSLLLNLGPLAHCAAKSIFTTGFGEEKYSVYCRMSSKKDGGSSHSKRPNSLLDFWEGCFKVALRWGLQGAWATLDILLFCWWWNNRVMFQESQSLTFWFKLVWGLCACGQPVVTVLRLEQFKGMLETVIYVPSGGAPWGGGFNLSNT